MTATSEAETWVTAHSRAGEGLRTNITVRDFAFVAAGTKDTGDGDEFGFGGIGHSKKAGTDSSVLVDFKGEAFAELHAACAEQRADGFGGTALPTDYFA